MHAVAPCDMHVTLCSAGPNYLPFHDLPAHSPIVQRNSLIDTVNVHPCLSSSQPRKLKVDTPYVRQSRVNHAQSRHTINVYNLDFDCRF